MRRVGLALAALLVVLAGFAASAVAHPAAPRSVNKPQVARKHEHGHHLGIASQPGGTLTGSAGTWTNTPTSFTYEWQDCNADASTCTTIGGSTATTALTSDTYTIQQADVGFYIRVGVEATNTSGSSAFVFSTVTAQITAPVVVSPPANTAVPAVSGTTMQLDPLTATTGTWSNSPTGYAYQWQRCTGSATTTCTNISAATSSTYTLAAGDVGDFMRVGVTATNAGGSTGPAYSVETAKVVTDLPVNTAAPSLSGLAVQGDTITLTEGTFSNETSQNGTWEQCPTATSTSCTATANTGDTYVLSTSDPVGIYIRLMEVATNANGNTTVWSNAIGPVTAGGGSSGYTGTCTKTISSSTTPNEVAIQEGTLSAGQVLCLNSGTYGTITTPSDCVGHDWDQQAADCNANVFGYASTGSGTSGNPIIVTSGPGQTATIQGAMEFRASNITLEHLNIDVTNQISETTGTGGATAVPPCTTMAKAQAIEVADAGSPTTNVTIQDNNIYGSVPQDREIGIFVGPSGSAGLLIKNNNISNFGSCDQTLHEIYDDGGNGGTITQNWFWSDQYGYGVQLYPTVGTTTVSSNVLDGMLDGFVDDTSVGGDTITHNVVINSVTANAITAYNTESFGGGAFMSCFHDQSGSTDTISNNAIWNDSGSYGCTSESGIAFSGMVTLSSNPFVNSAGRNYNLCVSGNTACTSAQITQASTVSGYGLWNGSGPPSPDPAIGLSAVLTKSPKRSVAVDANYNPKPVSPYAFLPPKADAPQVWADQARVDAKAAKGDRARATAAPNEQTTPWWVVTGAIVLLLAIAGGFAVWYRRKRAV